MEQQLKKAEAAQRRKVQIEKAARESEVGVFFFFFLHCAIRINKLADHERMILVLFSKEGAIKKILGQDSSRKKRGDKIKKRLDDLAQVLGFKHTINHLLLMYSFLVKMRC
jgi:hypothetical protein